MTDWWKQRDTKHAGWLNLKNSCVEEKEDKAESVGKQRNEAKENKGEWTFKKKKKIMQYRTRERKER